MSKIEYRPLPYQAQLDARKIEQIKLVVIHCTELPDLAVARTYGEKVLYPSGTGNSGHYYLDRNGHTEQWVDLNRVAHHVKGHNQQSIGIELVNLGRHPNWHHSQHQTMTEAYPQVQIQALIALLQKLHAELPNLEHIAGHEDLDTDTMPASDDASRSVLRKMDPGPLFPWDQLMPHIQLINIGTHAKHYE